MIRLLDAIWTWQSDMSIVRRRFLQSTKCPFSNCSQCTTNTPISCASCNPGYSVSNGSCVEIRMSTLQISLIVTACIVFTCLLGVLIFYVIWKIKQCKKSKVSPQSRQPVNSQPRVGPWNSFLHMVNRTIKDRSQDKPEKAQDIPDGSDQSENNKSVNESKEGLADLLKSFHYPYGVVASRDDEEKKPSEKQREIQTKELPAQNTSKQQEAHNPVKAQAAETIKEVHKKSRFEDSQDPSDSLSINSELKYSKSIHSIRANPRSNSYKRPSDATRLGRTSVAGESRKPTVLRRRSSFESMSKSPTSSKAVLEFKLKQSNHRQE